MRAHRLRLLLLFLSVGTGLSAAACLGPVPTFEGDHPARDVAVIRMGVLGRILEIDGEPWEGKAFQVLPGEHHLRFFVQIRAEEVHEFWHRRLNFECEATVLARAGRTYEIVRTPTKYLGRKDEVGVYRQDYQFDVRVRDARTEARVTEANGCHYQ
jgi:hypothetical protein